MICVGTLLFLTCLSTVFVAALKVAPLANALAGPSSCHFNVGNQEFDLCPVLEGKETGWTIEFENQTPPTLTRTQYKISLHGPLQRDQSLPDDEQCPEGSWVCMTMTNRPLKSPDEAPRVLQVIPVAGKIASQADSHYPGLNVTAQLSPSRENAHHDVLHIRFHGGYYVNRAQTADLQFFCDHTAEEPSNPSYYYSWNSTHAFKWKTKHACPLKSATDPPPSDSPDEEVSEPPPDEHPENETDLLTPVSDHPRRSIIMIILSSAAIVSLIVYVIYHPPRPLRQKLITFLKSRPALLRFRVGENVLVRWAEEDIELLDGEEDVMVNGETEAIFYTDEESIPLKPSPRKGRALSYGSAM